MAPDAEAPWPSSHGDGAWRPRHPIDSVPQRLRPELQAGQRRRRTRTTGQYRESAKCDTPAGASRGHQPRCGHSPDSGPNPSRRKILRTYFRSCPNLGRMLGARGSDSGARRANRSTARFIGSGYGTRVIPKQLLGSGGPGDSHSWAGRGRATPKGQNPSSATQSLACPWSSRRADERE